MKESDEVLKIVAELDLTIPKIMEAFRIWKAKDGSLENLRRIIKEQRIILKKRKGDQS